MGLWLTGWLCGQYAVMPTIRRCRVPLILLAAWLGIILLQVVPIPLEFLKPFSPGSAEAYAHPYGGIGRATAFLSIERSATLQYLGSTFAMVGFFALLLLVVNSESRLRMLCYALVFSGTFQAVLGIFLHFTEAKYTLFFEEVVHDPLTGSFLNRNHFAMYMEICISIGAGLMVSQFGGAKLRTWRQRVLWLAELLLSPKARLRILLIIMVVALIVTRSRMGNAALFAAILIGGVIGLGVSKVPSRALAVFLASIILLDVFIIGSWIGVEKVVQRVQNTTLTVSAKQVGGGSEESLEERAGPGMGALAVVRDFPIFGAGGKTFYVVYQRYRAAGTTGFFDHAHLDYAEFAAEGGVVGLSILAALGALSLGLSLTILKTRQNPLYRGLAFGSLIGLVAVALHSTVEFALQIPAIAFSFCVLLAIPWISRKSTPTKPART
jgi:O-antigen ligase